MAIALNTAGSWVAANATTQTVTLPTHATGDMLILRVGFKHATMPTTVTVGTAGWAKLGEINGGTNASVNNGGSVQVAVFWKEATSASETNPVVTFNAGVTAATPSAAVAISYSKAASELWSTPEGAGTAVAAATSISETIDSHISATSGDLIDEFHVTNDNTTLTVPTFTQASLTLNTVTELPATALSSTTSNDISADGCYRIATAGTSSAAAVITGTNSVADEGAGWTTRLRVTVATNAAAGNASGTGAANTASASIETNAGLSSGTGTAFAAAPGVGPSAGNAAGSGTAFVAAASVAPTAGVASGAGTANQASAGVSPTAGLASGTGQAFDATVETANNTNAAAELASGTGQANQPSAGVSPTAGHASGTGAAQSPSSGISPTAGNASGAGAAYNATVDTSGAATNANAGVASGTGSAFGASISIAANAGNAVGTGTAYGPTADTGGIAWGLWSDVYCNPVSVVGPGGGRPALKPKRGRQIVRPLVSVTGVVDAIIPAPKVIVEGQVNDDEVVLEILAAIL